MKKKNDFGKIEINSGFKKAIDVINSGKNVFITGKAGTGKSTLLQYFRENSDKKIVVLAPTGVAAINIKGQTIHSFFGFKPSVTLESVRKKYKDDDEKNFYKKLEMLIVDEISMVRADLMDCMDKFLRLNGPDKDKPFGGIQIIFIGDLYQLPPVVTSQERELFTSYYDSPYFFSAKTFNNFNLEFIELEKIYRQKDNEFIKLLNTIRNNSAGENEINLINRRYIPDFEPDKDDFYIYLTSVNYDADQINQIELDKLPGEIKKFEGYIMNNFDKSFFPTSLELNLKIGAQVMMLNNDPSGRWVNGTIGKIIGFQEDDLEDIIIVELSDGTEVEVTQYTWEIFKFFLNDNGKIESEIIGTFTQYPIRLAFAVTIHKSQGKTFDKVIIDVGKGTFAHGQMYVALSRCTTFEGLVLKKPLKKGNIRMDYKVQKFLTKYQYYIAEKALSREDKIDFIKTAIKEKEIIEIIYLKAKDEKSKRKLKPKSIRIMEYAGKEFLGLKAFCLLKNEERVFNVDRILEVKICVE